MGSRLPRAALAGLLISLLAMGTSTFTTLGLGALAPYLRASLHLSTFEVGVTLTMSPKSSLTSAYVRAISGQRFARPMLAACSLRLVYWPPGISWR